MNNTRVLIARVVGGIVEINQDGEYYPADDVLMLNNGAADSTGIVIINDTTARYMTNTQLDTAYILNELISVIDSVIDVTSSNAYLIAANTPVYGQIASFAAITTALETIKTGIEEHQIL